MQNKLISFLLLVSSLVVSLPGAAQTTINYDSRGRLVGTIYPDGTTISYVYDAKGNVLSQTITASGTFPVEWQSFTATPNEANRTVQLDWATASEQNNARFEVEHSTDGTTFAQIGSQPTGAGNSQTEQHYQFLHQNPAAGLNHYRVRQVDVDGQSSLSEVRTAMLPATQEIRLYPNPTHGQLTVEVPTQCTVTLFAASGAVVQIAHCQKGKNSLDISQLPAGVYGYRIAFPDGNFGVGSIVVE